MRNRANNTHNVAIYVRLSVEDIRKKMSDSIETQKSMLLQYLQKQTDMELYEIYEDVNYTGTNFNRPGFAKMICDIQAGLVDCVIVKDLSRFGRNFGETGNFLERVFPFLGVRFISVGDSYDTSTANIDESSLIVPLKNLMNEVYARDISKKVQSGIRIKQNRGELCGGLAPYGYIRKGKLLVMDEDTAPIVRLIFKQILEGYSDYMIASKLNEQKVMPPCRYRFEKGITKAKSHEDARFWHKSAIKRISENPAYTGVVAQGKQRSTFLKGGKYEFISRDKWIIVEDTHEAIIDKGTFEAVREIRDLRKKNHKIYTPVGNNIFKGLIFCADCGAHMTRRKLSRVDGNDEYYFSCNTYTQVDKHACTKKKVMESELNEILFYSIKSQIKLAVDVTCVMQDMQNKFLHKQMNTVHDKQIGTLQMKLKQNHRYRCSLREDYKDGILSEQDYIYMKANYENEKEGLQKELDILLSDKLHSGNTHSSKNKYSSLILNAEKTARILCKESPTSCFSVEYYKLLYINVFNEFETGQHLSSKIVSALIERIIVSDDARVDVRFSYSDEFQLY